MRVDWPVNPTEAKPDYLDPLTIVEGDDGPNGAQRR